MSSSTSSPAPTTVLMGLSGPSSSGKTTLARLLRSAVNLSVTKNGKEHKLSLFVLHEDDFYKVDKDVPIVDFSSPEHGTRSLQDWDCVESLDLDLFEHTLRYVKTHGALPPDTVSKEDQNSVGDVHVSDAEVRTVQEDVKSWFQGLLQNATTSSSVHVPAEIRICILDGFLLYPPAPPAPNTTYRSETEAAELKHLYDLSHALLSPRLFLPCSREQMLTRRLARTGYVTLEGFWVDPPGYVEDVVWPNYERTHSWMYTDNNADGGVFDEKICQEREGVVVCPGQGTLPMKECLAWGVREVKLAVEKRLLG
ncbi:ribosylnicotinamide kinase [Elasticomyces elasticus]|uniref:Ribosylnicotinamide kinase n=1 Tax=Exophiala sideris TaxID=1016849 RepID=A0ABR0J8D6_9EURO|nr:ribosylnicotinamide kinase [Elasticomyces elasticus]KAK5029877.1 ribosylnicotinamide kinase [Exophiala sideris]KAK5031683.1 ribosylnicotinamide kinase [Exophiala sideris]KAK5058361.1 ribosylnicotinamide kinase [Exophiala sideris]KAK5180290.1 ribosylnicotinamide kinase [Eurotiomycetes sp. CCFEE 6388]